jgi:hypothetical protein
VQLGGKVARNTELAIGSYSWCMVEYREKTGESIPAASANINTQGKHPQVLSVNC